MTTLEMEIHLMRYYDITQNLIVPNIQAWGSGLVRFETDLVVLSKAGFATGVEIKVSKADLKNDLKKDHIKDLNKVWLHGVTPLEAYYKNLKYFTYAVPEFLEEAALEQIPEFCGLLSCRKINYTHNYHRGDYTKMEIHTIRKPKILFKVKWDYKMRYNLARLGAMRILKYKEMSNRYKKELKDVLSRD